MSHQNLKGWLEEYAENSLSAEMTQDLEQHLAMCRDCQDQLRTIRLTANILRASRLDEGPVPAAGFARSVFLAIEQQRENYFFWSPLAIGGVEGCARDDSACLGPGDFGLHTDLF